MDGVLRSIILCIEHDILDAIDVAERAALECLALFVPSSEFKEEIPTAVSCSSASTSTTWRAKSTEMSLLSEFAVPLCSPVYRLVSPSHWLWRNPRATFALCT